VAEAYFVQTFISVGYPPAGRAGSQTAISYILTVIISQLNLAFRNNFSKKSIFNYVFSFARLY